MGPILLGVIALVILASFFVAYMSAKSWPVYQAVLAVFILLAAVGFFYLSARTLATHKAWRELARNQQQEHERLQNSIAALAGGVDTQGLHVSGEIPQLRRDLEKLVTDRGGALFDVAVDGVKDGVVRLTLKSADHGLAQNTVLFAFDQTPVAEGGRYQGEFKVVAVGENSPAIQVAANLPLTEAQAQRLAAAKGTWTLYTTMPVDDAELFAKLSDDERAALMPKESQAEYADANRPLRDYEYFFHNHYVQRTLLTDAISKLQSNISRMEAATEEVNREIAYRDTEKANLQGDLEKFRFETDAVAKYQGSLEKQLAAVRESLKNTYVQTVQQATLLTSQQLRAAEEINARTSAAQASTTLAPSLSSAR